MAEPTLGDLNYGHPGAASFDLDNGQWSFTRQHATRKLKQIRPWQNAVSPAPTLAIPASARFPTVIAKAHSTSSQKAARRLVQAHPELAPSSELLPELALVSAAIERTTATYDPFVGDLLSFGSGPINGRGRIAAIPTGEAGNILQLTAIDRVERLSWETDRSVSVHGSTLKSTTRGYWNEDAAPLQQVCFAQSEDGISLLAVRLPKKIVFLRTMYHNGPRAAKPARFYRMPASMVTAHPILKLGLDETGGAAHAHVTFNPDYQFQLGIVDQNRTWSIWDIEHGRKRDTYTITRLVSGSILPPDVEEPAGEDGWARILWVGDINTLLICCRRQLSIVSIEGDTFEHLPCPNVFAKRSLDWILDVQQHPRFRSRFFVLTSTFLILMSVTTSSEALDANLGQAGASIVASWRHYRGAEDFTLHICVQTLSDDGVGVVLYSRLNHLIHVYTFTQHSSSPAAVVVASDPVPLDLMLDSPGRIAQLYIEPMQYAETRRDNMSPGPGRFQMESGNRFYRIFALQSDLSIHELVVCAYDRKPDAEFALDRDVQVLTKTVVKHKLAMSQREIVECDEFIVPEGLDNLTDPLTMTPSQVPRWTQSRGRTLVRGVMDYGLLYNALTQMEDTQEESIDIVAVTERLKQMLTAGQSASPIPVGTLMDALGSKFQVLDVDEASSIFQELKLSETSQIAAYIHPIASPRVLNFGGTDEPTIADVYDTILESWVAPLPRHVPVHVRRRKERLARLIAAEVNLASRRIHYEQPQLSAIESQRNPSQDSGIALPILPSKPPKNNVQNDSDQWSLSQSLPTLTHSSIPSSSMPPSSPPMSPFIPPAASDPVERLSRHLQLREASLTPTIIPPNVNRLLEHWSLGTDPHTYDWSATEDALREETIDETTQKQRERDRKKQERREKRQERENELMRSKASSQLFPFPQSSQGPTLAGMGSSSQIPSQSYTQVPLPGCGFTGPGGINTLAPLSQVEPGRFGGRLDLKKKKKKGRVSGF